jgi:predicted nucleotidyltransferase
LPPAHLEPERPEVPPPEADPLLREIVDRLVAALRPSQIVLFGSRARGDAHAESDYDLLVLVDVPSGSRYRRSREAYRALKGIPAAVDVVVWDRTEFERRRHLPASFAATVLREGKILHAA